MLAEDFQFVAPIVGPLGKAEFMKAPGKESEAEGNSEGTFGCGSKIQFLIFGSIYQGSILGTYV